MLLLIFGLPGLEAVQLILISFTTVWSTLVIYFFFFFSSRRRHTRFDCDWSSDVCSSDLARAPGAPRSLYCPPSRQWQAASDLRLSSSHHLLSDRNRSRERGTVPWLPTRDRKSVV